MSREWEEWEAIRAWIGRANTAASLLQTDSTNELARILEAMGDCHSRTAARLVSEASSRDGTARDTKVIAAISQIEAAYTTLSDQWETSRGSSREFTARLFAWTTLVGRRQLIIAQGRTQVALLLAMTYHGLGHDRRSVEQWLQRAELDQRCYASCACTLNSRERAPRGGSLIFRLRRLVTDGLHGLAAYERTANERMSARINHSAKAVADAMALVRAGY